MKCKVCESNKITITYNGKIRNGGLGKYTCENVEIFRCENCDVIWHAPILENNSYYESQEYRESLEGSSDEQDFYRLHDKDNLDKFTYTGTTIFRNKIVADIGCGCGSFLDYVSGVAKEIVAIEPSEIYRNIMDTKGFKTYSYAREALREYKFKVDVITSFDVIEHVEDPECFIKGAYELLAEGGQAIIGTPTETPIMRMLLREDYERKLLFSTQHIWILAEKNMRIMAQKSGIPLESIEFKYFQRYGIGNVFGWLREKEPCCNVSESFITRTLDNVWKNECESQGLSDYIVMYIKK